MSREIGVYFSVVEMII